jgi:Baseplate J-like protein
MPLQVPNLDDRTAEQLYAEAIARVRVHTPEWTNLADSDPGVTIVQLFSFMTENLLYRSNRIPEANRLKFLKLLGIPLQPATAGRGLVVFINDRGPVQPFPLDAGVELRAEKVPFRTRTGLCVLPVTASVFYKKPQAGLDPATLDQYRQLYEPFLDTDADQLQFYTSTSLEPPELGKPMPSLDLADSVTGTIDRSLWVALVGPQNVDIKDVRRTIARQTLALGIYPAPRCEGKVLEPARAELSEPTVRDPGLVFEIADPDATVTDTLAPPRYTALQVDYAEDVLDTAGIVQVTLPAFERLNLWDFDPQEEGAGDYPPIVEDKELAQRIATWIRIRLPRTPTTPGSTPGTSGTTTVPVAPSGAPPIQQARISWVGVNAARAIQAVLVPREQLGVGTGAPDQVLNVANRPVIVGGTEQGGSGEIPVDTFVLEVQNEDGGWDTWRRTDDLFAAGPEDAVYALDPESGQVSCGSGLRGKRFPLGRIIRARYEFGGGPPGNVPIGAINKSPVLPPGFKIENPVATWGADSGEDAAAGERNIPRYLKHRDRLVTASDFRDLTLRTPGVDIGRVEILPLFHPDLFSPTGPAPTSAGTVTILVIPRSDPEQPDAPIPDRLFLEAVCEWLEPRRLVTTEVFVRGPIYVPLWVTVGITTMAGQVRELVRRNVQAAIREYLSPLFGGPPVAGTPDADLMCEPVRGRDPCAPPRGTGWQLGMLVRRQDLEAVATRVPGVRYVDSVRLAVTTPGGATLTDVAQISIAGLQLPHLVGIGVREGTAEDPAVLLGQQPALTPGNVVPVPLLPQKC